MKVCKTSLDIKNLWLMIVVSDKEVDYKKLVDETRFITTSLTSISLSVLSVPEHQDTKLPHPFTLS